MLKPCLLCKKLLEPAMVNWDTNQPHGGGEIQLIFSYGSCKFDNNVGATTFKALICDECAEGLVGDMEEGSYDS